MTDFLKMLLSLSFSGTILILLLFLIKPIIYHRVSKKWQYYIWLIVIARLLIPFTSEISLVNRIFQQVNISVPAADTGFVTDQKGYLRIPYDRVPGIHHDTGTPVQKEKKIPLPVNESPAVQWILAAVWIMVAGMLFIRKVMVYRKFIRYIRRESTEVWDIGYLERLGRAMEQMNIKQNVRIYVNQGISSPLIAGVFRVSIAVPNLELPDSDYYYTLLHELTHHKRRDILYKWLVQMTVCLHWFNPFVYLMGKEINHACELSCDEAVIKNLDYEKMRSYGDTLLHAAGAGVNHHNSFAVVALLESKKLLEKRLYCIMNYKKNTRLMTAAKVLLTIVLCAGAIGLGAYHSSKAEEIGNEGSTQVQTEDNGAITRSYYTNGYIIVMEWREESDLADFYSVKSDLMLEDQSAVTVYFDDTCKSSAEDQTLLPVLAKLISLNRKDPQEPRLSVLSPVVTQVSHVDADLKQIAEEYGLAANLTSIQQNMSEEEKTALLEELKAGGGADLTAMDQNMSEEEKAALLEELSAGGGADLSAVNQNMSEEEQEAFLEKLDKEYGK